MVLSYSVLKGYVVQKQVIRWWPMVSHHIEYLLVVMMGYHNIQCDWNNYVLYTIMHII